MLEVGVRDGRAVFQAGAAAATPRGVNLLVGESGEPFDRVVAVVLTAEERGEAVLAEVVRAGDVPQPPMAPYCDA